MSWPIFTTERVAQMDLALCQRANRACTWRAARRFFRVVSRLGNGVFWYALMAVLPAIYGREGLAVSLRMAVAGLAGVAVYKLIKHFTHRPRPYVSDASILPGAPPLDQYSFPSGHTLHAVSFTLIACAAFPALALLLVPFTLLVAMSRVVLGLHYPTDVLLGAAIGGTLAWLLIPAPF